MEFQISIEETSEVERSIKIEVSRDIYSREYNRILGTTAARAQIKGFRPGKVPREMVAKLYGRQIRDDVVRDLAMKGYEQALAEHKLNVVGWPDIDIDDELEDRPVTITASVAIYPKPTISDYFGSKIEVATRSVSDEDVVGAEQRLRESYGSIEPIEGRTVAELGDVAQVDYHGSVEGVEQEALHEHGAYVELGQEKGIPGFEKAIVGMNVGEEKEVTLDLPANMQDENLAGKKADYRIHLRGLSRKTLPELTEEFVKEHHLAENLEDLRVKIRESLEKEIEKQNRQAKEAALFGVLVENNPFVVPQKMLLEEVRQILFEFKALDPKKRESYSIDVSQFLEPLGKMAEERVRRGVVLQRIIEQENFQATDEDLETWIEKIASDSKRTAEEIKSSIGFSNNKTRFRDALTREKMLDKLLESASISEKAASEAEDAGSEKQKAKKSRAKDKTSAKDNVETSGEKKSKRKAAKKAEE